MKKESLIYKKSHQFYCKFIGHKRYLGCATVIHMSMGKKSQDFSGVLSGNIDLTEVMTIWKSQTNG